MIPFLILIPDDCRNKELMAWLFRTGINALNLRHVRVAPMTHQEYSTVDWPDQLRQSRLFNTPVKEISLSRLSFSSQGIIEKEGVEDLLLTIFYVINCLQEYNSEYHDDLNRFTYKGSYQHRFDKVTENWACRLFENIFELHFKHLLRNRIREKSSIFLSHDIDSLYGALMQDGLAALKRGRVDVMARVITNTFLMKPDWFNIDRIIKIENDHGVRSCFFWLVNKGRINKRLTNSDYRISSGKVRKAMRQVSDAGGEIGLHKSLSSESFDEELGKLPAKTILNRNHYLKFKLPDHFQNIETSQIKIDCSLGFAEQFGFRNSLAIPFVPYDTTNNVKHNFLEVPLNLMDGTFQKYLGLDPEECSRQMIALVQKNSENSVISVLWHNHFFSSFRFRGYFRPYVDFLMFMQEQNFPSISAAQLYKKYYF